MMYRTILSIATTIQGTLNSQQKQKDLTVGNATMATSFVFVYVKLSEKPSNYSQTFNEKFNFSWTTEQHTFFDYLRRTALNFICTFKSNISIDQTHHMAICNNSSDSKYLHAENFIWHSYVMSLVYFMRINVSIFREFHAHCDEILCLQFLLIF